MFIYKSIDCAYASTVVPNRRDNDNDESLVIPPPVDIVLTLFCKWIDYK